MPGDMIAPMVVAIVLILTLGIGGVILLRPPSKRLGELLKVMTGERKQPAELERTLARMRHALESVDERLSLLEERQDFTGELMRTRPARELEGEVESK